jgi:fructan beta-fructosidase
VIGRFVLVLGIVGCSRSSAPVCEPPVTINEGEAFRQAFHFSPPSGWMNDPNGLVFADGEYHLFYQHNPDSIQWGNVHWGHAVSADLLTWQDLPIALAPHDTLGWAFSGSAVIDAGNTSGQCAGDDCMVAVYTHAGGDDRLQKQSVAFSDDAGRTFTEYAGNPVLPNPGDEPDFRDPRVFRHGDRWIMALASGDRAGLFSSEDLLNWAELSEFGPITDASFPSWTWEVVDLFALQVHGEERWVLKTDLLSRPLGPTTGRYWVGDFDGTRFTIPSTEPPAGRVFDGGADFYAAISYNGLPVGEQIWIGWQASWAYAFSIPTEPWRGSMSVPRLLRLVDDGEGPVLTQTPYGVEAGREECPLVDFSPMSLRWQGCVKRSPAFRGTCSTSSSASGFRRGRVVSRFGPARRESERRCCTTQTPASCKSIAGAPESRSPSKGSTPCTDCRCGHRSSSRSGSWWIGRASRCLPMTVAP